MDNSKPTPDGRAEFKKQFINMAYRYGYRRRDEDAERIAEEFFQWLIERYEPRPQPITDQQKAQWDVGGSEQSRK